MKKHLIVAAVAAAVAAPAMAQNVSLYGLLDAGYGEIEKKETGDVVGKKRAFGFNSHSSSRFGIRGTEDLGGFDRCRLSGEGHERQLSAWSRDCPSQSDLQRGNAGRALCNPGPPVAGGTDG